MVDVENRFVVLQNGDVGLCFGISTDDKSARMRFIQLNQPYETGSATDKYLEVYLDVCIENVEALKSQSQHTNINQTYALDDIKLIILSEDSLKIYKKFLLDFADLMQEGC